MLCIYDQGKALGLTGLNNMKCIRAAATANVPTVACLMASIGCRNLQNAAGNGFVLRLELVTGW